jgi:rfaE bifunctional protein kinase chain/domain
MGNNHQVLRVDEEIKNELDKKDQSIFLETINKIFENEELDCVLFQDYDKGVLNEKNITYIINKSNSLNIPTIADPKNNNFSYYRNITLFKPNFKEFKEGLHINDPNRKESLEYGSKILHKNEINIVFVTLSESGIFVSYKIGKKIINKIIPGVIREVVDVSGAGDTVAAITAMLINQVTIEEMTKIANLAGGMVCEEVGVVPIDKTKLLDEYYESKDQG